jgi:tRNA1(Val) A37 N6-methylase TrmN6
MIKYHKGDASFAFLNCEKVQNFDDLNSLFFSVLARKPDDRNEEVRKIFANVPYLNSSLFEPTDIEHSCLFISQLKDDKLPIITSTVLKDNNGKKCKGELLTLEYIFKFLDAYDFAGEGAEEIQEENKTLINASVLGLIFEKINGYKDGSFFTPGFITMYMCHETIRRSVVQKLNEAKGWVCTDINQLYDKIEDRNEANNIINSLKICDPAVGSGHFLVSALNEIIAIKSDLNILQDREGRRLKEYRVEVVNDELIVTDEDGELFEYNLRNKESQRIQQTLFHEKQTIIENCLFGVDINPNSVKICRLRLWIELLKNAYYKEPDFTELETLPNIDINIKCGNSLISRYALDADIRQALKKSKWNIFSYRMAVMTYRNASGKEQKREMERLIESIKTDFETEVAANDKRFLQLIKLNGDLFNLTQQTSLFERSKKELEEWNKRIQHLGSSIQHLELELESIKSNKIYENAFEWRFEFPEVLNDEGDFVGFDVVIGNPPYFSLSKIKEQATYFESLGYQTYSKGSDIYCLFYERGNHILKNGGFLTYITSNSWLKVIYGDLLKKYLLMQMQPILLLNIEDIQVFEEATVESSIFTLQKGKNDKLFFICNLTHNYSIGSSLNSYISNNGIEFKVPESSEWIIGNREEASLKQKIERNTIPLKEFNVTINFGIKTGYNLAFVIDEGTKVRLITDDPKCTDIIKPILRGRDISKYGYGFSGLYLISTHNGLRQKNIERINAEVSYPSIFKHLSSFLPQIERRQDKGDHWTNLRSCAYWEDFELPKIIWGEISDKPKFAFDDSNYYAEATTFIMTGEKLKYLLAILNSKVSEWYFNQISTTTGMGTNRWKKYKIELLPIKIPTEYQVKAIESLVNQILVAKKSDSTADTTALEKEIDQLVYKLYELTEEEIKIVEES